MNEIRYVEGVPYYRFRVSFRTVDGKRHRIIRWSPFLSWAYQEVGREMLARGDVVPRTVTVRQVSP